MSFPTPQLSGESSDAARLDLAADALHRAGRLRLQARGESMLPTLWPGDEVELVGCHLEDVQLGEIVLAQRQERFFLHRLVAREAGQFVLRGDSMAATDPTYQSAAFLGRLLGVMQGGRPVALRSRAWTRPLGWLLCHCGPARRIALRLHQRWNAPRETFDTLAPPRKAMHE